MKWDEYSIGEIFIAVITIIYIYYLSKYKLILIEIQQYHVGKLDQAFAVAQEPSYFNYFFGGILLIIVLVGFSFVHIKCGKTLLNKLIISLINLLLLIVLIYVFWNPILTSFAVILCCGGIFSMSQS